MPYTNLDQLTDRFGTPMLVNLTDRGTPQTGMVDSDIVDRALADTDAMIDGHLAGKYVLPMAEVPPLVADLAAMIAIYKLHIYTPGEKIVDDYKQALRSLEKISLGTIKLSVAGVPSASSQGSGARMTDRERPLTAQNMKGFI